MFILFIYLLDLKDFLFDDDEFNVFFLETIAQFLSCSMVDRFQNFRCGVRFQNRDLAARTSS